MVTTDMTIAQLWERFRGKSIPADEPEDSLARMRLVFYGAATSVALLTAKADTAGEDVGEVVERLMREGSDEIGRHNKDNPGT